MSVVTITGHRPNKLYGYDLRATGYAILRSFIKKRLTEFHCTELYTGMALGVDQLAALAILDLRDEGLCIKLHAAVPCRGHSSRWPKTSRDLYDAILSKCDTVTLVTDAPYSAPLMQRRNAWMADRADLILAVWDGSPGGTKNCVDYARKTGKPVWRHDPFIPGNRGWIDGAAWPPG